MAERAEQRQDDAAVQAPNGPFIESPTFAMKRAVVALGYELPEAVWADVREKWNAVADEHRRLRAALRLAVDLASKHSDNWTKDDYRHLDECEAMLDAE